MPFISGQFQVRYTTSKNGSWVPFGTGTWVLANGDTGGYDWGGDPEWRIDLGNGAGYGAWGGPSFPTYSQIRATGLSGFPGFFGATSGSGLPPPWNTPSESFTFRGTLGAPFTPGTLAGDISDIESANYTASVTEAGGAAQLTFTTGDHGIASGSFIVPNAPSVSSISPALGPPEGGTPITINGAHFAADTTFTLGGNDVTDLVFVSSSIMTGVTPAHALGSVRADALNIDGQTGGTNHIYLYYYPPLTLTAVLPDSGGIEGFDTVQLIGTNFLDGIVVLFGSTPATGVIVVSDTSLYCFTPPHVVGLVDVSVINAARTDPLFATLTNAYTYILIVTAPIPDAGLPQVAKGPLPSFIFTDAVVIRGINNGILSYNWAAKPGNPAGTFTIGDSTALNTSITFTSYVPGDYYFTLTAMDEGGYFAIQSDFHIIVPPPSPPKISALDLLIGG